MKKVIICFLLVIAILFTIFKPGIAMDSFGEVLEYGGSLGNLIFFVCCATGLLFCFGVKAGWNFGKNCGFGLFGKIVFAFLGLYLSFPIAIVKLLTPSNPC